MHNDLKVFSEEAGDVGLKVPKPDSVGGDEKLFWDESAKEWSITGKLSGEVSAVGSDGEIQYNDGGTLGASPDLTFDGTVVSFPELTLTNNNTTDTSGDLQIRDDSNGDLFSLDDGSSPQLSAKYEGDGAFTFGRRTGSVGNNSFVVGGGSFDPNEASDDYTVAVGNNTTASGPYSVALGLGSIANDSAAFAHGGGLTGNVATASGQFSYAGGDNVTASGYASHAEGLDTVASADNSHAGNFDTEASAINSRAVNRRTATTAEDSFASGRQTVARVATSTVVGAYNEDYLGSGNEIIYPNLGDTGSERIFTVGVGLTDSDRRDGLYVTLRDGTHIRHGLSVDGYNSSTGQYETVFEVDETGTITKGSVSVDGSSLNAAGPDGAIQFNNNDNFDGVSSFTYDPSTLALVIKGDEATITNEVSGVFGGFLDSITKVRFPTQEITEKSELPRPFNGDFPSTSTITGGTTFQPTKDEDYTTFSTTFFYPYSNEQRFEAQNPQGYIDWGSSTINSVAYSDFTYIENMRGDQFGISNMFGRTYIRGTENDIRSSGSPAPDVSNFGAVFSFEQDDGSINKMASYYGGHNFSNASGGDITELSQIKLYAVDYLSSNVAVENYYGINQKGSFMDNFFEGSLVQSSGGIIFEEDNRNIEYSLNQRTTGGAQKTLKIDSQGADIVPDAQNEATWEFSGKVVARVESGNPLKTNAMAGDSHVWEFEGVFTSRVENASLGTYNVEFIGQPVVSTIATNPEVEDYSVNITKNDDGELFINVTGENGATVNWSGQLEVNELVA